MRNGRWKVGPLKIALFSWFEFILALGGLKADLFTSLSFALAVGIALR
jgi:hypothetical protein